MGEHSCLTTAKKLKSLALMKNVINQKDTEGGFRRIKAIITCSCPSKENCVPLWREAITDRRVEEALENQGPSWPYRKVKMKIKTLL